MVQSFPWNGRRRDGPDTSRFDPGQIFIQWMKIPAIGHDDWGSPSVARQVIAQRGAIQNSKESLRALWVRYGINQKTVAMWRKQTSVADQPTGPRDAKSTVLTLDNEAVIVAFRRHTLLPLDDCLYSLRPMIPHPLAGRRIDHSPRS